MDEELRRRIAEAANVLRLALPKGGSAMWWVLPVCLCASPGSAQVVLPLSGATASAWLPQPAWIPNPAERPSVSAEDGALVFTVTEPHRGMKWCLDTKPISAELPGYLIVRCRGENLVTAGPYVLWGFDQGAGGALINASDLPADGQWHEVAVDLYAAGRRGFVNRLAVEVQAGDQVPARLAIESIRAASEAPEGVIVLPAQPAQPREWREEFDGQLTFSPHKTWLANPADDGQHALEQSGGQLVVTATAPGKGMKWSAQYDTPPDLTGMSYCTIRYRATGVPAFGDYVAWVGSDTGGQPQKSLTLFSGGQVRSDGRWHTDTVGVKDLFPVKEIAVQVQADSPQAKIELDYVALSDVRPLLPFEEISDCTRGWTDLRLAEGQVTCLDLAPAANHRGAALARLFGLQGWLPRPKATVSGIPFQLTEGPQDVAAIPLGSTEPYAIPIGRKASELFLLMAIRLPSEDYSGMLGARPLGVVTDPERFCIAVDYEDGLTDWQSPARAIDGAHAVEAGVEAYALSGLRDVAIKQIRLRSAMPNAVIAVAGITANTGEPVTAREAITALPPFVPTRDIEERAPEMARRGSRLLLRNAYVGAELDFSEGVGLARLDNSCLKTGAMTVAPGPLFVLRAGEAQVDSRQVKIGTVTRERAEAVRLTVPVDARPAGIPLEGTLTVELGRGPELEMSLDLTHVGNAVLKPEVTFPVLKQLVVGDVANTWYLDGRQGGVINRVPMSMSAVYSGRHPMQVTDFFNPQAGGGLYVMTHDLRDIYRYYAVTKGEQGIDFAIDYYPREYQPGEKIEIAPTAIVCHTGDWREALAAYRRWVKTWYRLQVPRKQWFLECFNYRQHLLREGLYDFPTKTYHMNEALQKDIDFFGRVDYFHLFDFGQSDTYGRVGDYSHYDEIGGAQALADAIRGVQNQDVRVGLYIEGYLVDERGVFGREHVNDWHIFQGNGQPLLWDVGSPEHMMCPSVAGWQEYLASTYQRVASELHPDGMYIDQHGFGNEWKICWGRDHGHFVPMPPIRGEQQMDRKIRAATPPTIATLTEETPTDVNSQYQDGALGYSVAFTDFRLAPHGIDLFRFCFPDFKVFQLVAYNNFVDGGWGLLKYPFFNGEGTWLGNGIPAGFDADAQAFLRTAFRLLHEHRAAFTSRDVEALVPTENPTICANRFTGPSETVWTLQNLGYSTHRGPVLRVRHVARAKYVDLWHNRPVQVKLEGDSDILSVEIGPREVGCMARVSG